MSSDKTEAQRQIEREQREALRRAFETNWKVLGGPELQEEFSFHPDRGWSLDFCILGLKVAIEVEGGVWVNGRHNRAKGFIEDAVKYNTAAAMGWTIFRLPEPLVNDPDHLLMIIEFIERKPV